jgi:hypothetical protein
MSADRVFVLYHLMPTEPPSWVSGEDGSAPDGRLLSSELEIYQGSPFGKERRRWTRVWKHPTLSVQQANQLETNHPKPEPMSELSPEMLRRISSN